MLVVVCLQPWEKGFLHSIEEWKETMGWKCIGTVLGHKISSSQPTTLTNKPNTQVKECHLYKKPFRSAEWWILIFQWSKFHFSDISSPGTQSIDLFCLPLCKVWWSKANSDEMWHPWIWSCFWASLVSQVHQVAWHQMKLIRAWGCVMLRAEWTITARRAVLCLAQIKYIYCPRTLQAES